MEKRTGITKLHGKPLTLLGKEIKINDEAPNFTVLQPDLTALSLADTKGKVRVISVVPSIDTPVCDIQTSRFNHEAAQFTDMVILSISVDLPFALQKYCAAKDITNVKTLSDHKDLDFGLKYGFVIEELRLLARGALVIDRNDIVQYVEYVATIEDQPNYDKILEIAKKFL